MLRRSSFMPSPALKGSKLSLTFSAGQRASQCHVYALAASVERRHLVVDPHHQAATLADALQRGLVLRQRGPGSSCRPCHTGLQPATSPRQYFCFYALPPE